MSLATWAVSICATPHQDAAGATLSKATTSAIATGSRWYEGVYRPDLSPAHCYFRERLEVGRPRDNPRRLVTLLYEFLDAPHGELRALYSNRLPPLKTHRVGNAREVLLGV